MYIITMNIDKVDFMVITYERENASAEQQQSLYYLSGSCIGSLHSPVKIVLFVLVLIILLHIFQPY